MLQRHGTVTVKVGDTFRFLQLFRRIDNALGHESESHAGFGLLKDA